jgi:hypothetical protein
MRNEVFHIEKMLFRTAVMVLRDARPSFRNVKYSG